MGNLFKITAKILVLIFSLGFISQENAPIKIACVGDSITYGYGITDRENKNYPAQLKEILGKGYETENFGVNGATLLKKGEKPYWKQGAFQKALDYQPDAVVIKLGTNDSKPQNWKYHEDFISDYRGLIERFHALESKPEIWICLPAPVYGNRWGISHEIVTTEIKPRVHKIAGQENVHLINLYRPLSGRPELFPDLIHPNAKGAEVMARKIAENLRQFSFKN